MPVPIGWFSPALRYSFCRDVLFKHVRISWQKAAASIRFKLQSLMHFLKFANVRLNKAELLVLCVARGYPDKSTTSLAFQKIISSNPF